MGIGARMEKKMEKLTIIQNDIKTNSIFIFTVLAVGSKNK